MDKYDAYLRLQHIRKIFENDTEQAHIEADQVLIDLLESLGCGNVVDEFKSIDKWYS